MANYLGQATAAKDWALAIRILEIKEVLTPQMGGDAAEDLIEFNALVVDGHREEATQWPQAVASYSSALGTTG